MRNSISFPSMSRLLPALGAASLVLAAACGSGHGPRKPTADELLNGDPLPLAMGAKWTYNATITTYDVDTGNESVRNLTWVTEVTAARPSADGRVMAYDIKGWPGDLSSAWGETPLPSTRTMLRSNGSFLWAAPNANDGLDDAAGWFTWPLTDGQRICPDPEGVYCWISTATDEGYKLSYRTGPDDESYLLQPGTGVARYTYSHHGTTNDVTAVLTDYKPGTPSATAP